MKFVNKILISILALVCLGSSVALPVSAYTLQISDFHMLPGDIPDEENTGASLNSAINKIRNSTSPQLYTKSSQLSPEGQKVYNELLNAIENQETTVNLPVMDLVERNQIDTLIHQEHPELYYAGNIGAGELHTDKNGRQWEKVNITYNLVTTDLKQVVQDFLSGLPRNSSDYEKELYVHDKLVDETYYEDMKYTEATISNSIRDCLVHHATSSLGYAYTMKAIMGELNIPCTVIQGTYTRNGKTIQQAWNKVTLNGKQYLTDVFQDDPNGRQHNMSHRWFNLTQREMDQDHHPSNHAIESGCNSTDQNYYRKNNLFFHSTNDAEKAIKTLLSTKIEAEVRLSSAGLANQVLNDYRNGKVIQGVLGSESDLTNNVVSVYSRHDIKQ